MIPSNSLFSWYEDDLRCWHGIKTRNTPNWNIYFQEKIAARGSGQVSLKDIDKLDQLSQQIDGIHSKTDGHSSLDSSLEHLKEQMEKLRQATVTKDDTEDNKDNSKK